MRPPALYYRMMRYQPGNLELIEKVFELRQLDNPTEDRPELLADVEVLFAPLGFGVGAAKMDLCPKLRAIVSNTTGIPHIDAGAAAQRQVAVCALHDEQPFLETITPTAEHTIGLMLAACRRLPAAHAAATAGAWDRRPWGAPRMLSRLRLGIVGLGRVGRRVAKCAKAMGMAVAYFDPYVDGGEATLLDLAGNSDVLSLHAPANAETAGLVSRQVLEALPAGGVVVNTARGELLDTDALLDLLEAGRLWAAGIDTIDGEYDLAFSETFADGRLARYAREHDNLILTPHIGGSTLDAWFETERRVIEKAMRTLNLEMPQ